MKYTIELNEDEEFLAYLLCRLEERKTVNDWVDWHIHTLIREGCEQILSEHYSSGSWNKDFSEAGISNKELSEAVKRAEKLGTRVLD